jgi:diguanylate cyclase (GGDEF)-like protein
MESSPTNDASRLPDPSASEDDPHLAVRTPALGGLAVPVDLDDGVNAEALARVLDHFAETVIRDFAVDDILRQLVLGATEVLRDVEGAGVVVPTPSGELLRLAFSSPDPISELESLQESLQDGPCRTAHDAGEIITVEDLAQIDTWQPYRDRALELGVHSVTAVPLRARGRLWGVLDLYRKRPGRLSTGELTAAHMLANLATSYLVVTADRDDARRAKDEFAYRAMHDPLTGLPTRWVFLEQLAHSLSRLERHPGHVGLIFVDLDGLKSVNDTFGHLAGDQLIVGCVQRIRSALRPDDVLARLGGDEFVVMFEQLPASGEANVIADRILEKLAEPINIDGHWLTPSASLGLAVTDDPTMSADTLIAHADAAMYHAKHAGRGRYETFDQAKYTADRDDASAREQLTRDLESALQAGELELHYQPIIDLTDHSRDALPGRSGVFAVEALLRWRHPTQGLLSAESFVEAAMRSRLGGALSAWVLSTACRQLAEWDDQLGSNTPQHMFVNVSAAELTAAELGERVTAALRHAGLAASRLTLEITETGLLPDPEAARRSLKALRTLGCQVAVDDFGTGYSSLSRLVQIPASTLKVDQSFTQNMDDNPDAAAVVSAVVLLGESLGRRVIVEGVEDAGTLSQLRKLGSTYVQGEYLSRAKGALDLTPELAQQPWRGRI